MLQFDTHVKFLKKDNRSGVSKKTGEAYSMDEMLIFVPDLGRLKIPVVGNPVFPDPGSVIQLSLSVDQGSFQSLRAVFDSCSKFQVVK